jgi:hypothetical protein
MRTFSIILAVVLGASACRSDDPPKRVSPGDRPTQVEAEPGTEPKVDPGPEVEPEPEDPRSGEAAHVIPFADRTSMGYLLLLPASTKLREAPSREQLQALVRQAFPERRRDGELDLLLTLIATEPHTTELGGVGEIEPPTLDEDADAAPGPAEDAALPTDPAQLEELAAKRERERIFDLIGLHIEIVPLGIGDTALIPSWAFEDPVLTAGVSEAERKTLLGRSRALLLRADYRNQHAVRGLRLHQTLVRVVAEHFGALIHDPDTLETMNLETFTERRLRAAAGNVADQIAIVPFGDRRDDKYLRLSTRGMRRFGSVDVELDGLPRDLPTLQRASDLLAGLALALAKEAEVDPSGFAVEVPETIVIDGELIRQSYSARDYVPALCEGCPGVEIHLVERPPEDHDPEDHVVARVVAVREKSDAPDYDHPQWVLDVLAQLFDGPGDAGGDAGDATPPTSTD